MGTEIGRLVSGEFNAHRTEISRVDGSDIVATEPGANGYGFEVLLIDVSVHSGVLTGATLEVLTYSEASGQLVEQSPPAAFDMSGPAQFVFSSLYGRRFFVRVNRLAGTNPVIDISVSAFRRTALELA
jgi:hypothetical protein